MRQLSARRFPPRRVFQSDPGGILIRLNFVAEIVEESFKRLPLIRFDKPIQQFQGAHGASKMII
jgi:hypothetical protein